MQRCDRCHERKDSYSFRASDTCLSCEREERAKEYKAIVSEIRSAYQSGLSIADVARVCQKSANWIRKIISGHGMQAPEKAITIEEYRENRHAIKEAEIMAEVDRRLRENREVAQ